MEAPGKRRSVPRRGSPLVSPRVVAKESTFHSIVVKPSPVSPLGLPDRDLTGTAPVVVKPLDHSVVALPAPGESSTVDSSFHFAQHALPAWALPAGVTGGPSAGGAAGPRIAGAGARPATSNGDGHQHQQQQQQQHASGGREGRPHTAVAAVGSSKWAQNVVLTDASPFPHLQQSTDGSSLHESPVSVCALSFMHSFPHECTESTECMQYTF